MHPCANQAGTAKTGQRLERLQPVGSHRRLMSSALQNVQNVRPLEADRRSQVRTYARMQAATTTTSAHHYP